MKDCFWFKFCALARELGKLGPIMPSVFKLAEYKLVQVLRGARFVLAAYAVINSFFKTCAK